MNQAAIRIEDLSKTYRDKKHRRVIALSELNLEITSGEVFGFLGPNGAGKSTTIKSLMGLITPSSGQAFLAGVPIQRAEARKNVGYLPENPAFYDFLSAREYLAFVGSSFGMPKNEIASATDRVLELLQLYDAASRSIRTYSKGMVQRLGLAQTLLHDPDLYVFDEPMSGLDPLGRALVKDIIRDLKSRGKTVFFSSHITADVESVCDRVGIIVQGRLRTVQLVDELLRSGIQGYKVCVRGGQEILEKYTHRRISEEVHEYEVTRHDFNRFSVQVANNGATVELVEPIRSDLEAFFLDIVKENSVVK